MPMRAPKLQRSGTAAALIEATNFAMSEVSAVMSGSLGRGLLCDRRTLDRNRETVALSAPPRFRLHSVHAPPQQHFAATTHSAGRPAPKDTIMDDLYWRLVDFLQAFAAGLLVGGTYGLMCVGLGIIFGVMRVVNFAHGDFMMLGMYAAFYLVTGFGVLGFLGPYAGPIVGAVLAGPIVFAIGWVLHKFLISPVTGARVMSAEAEGHYAQIILTLGIALVLANGGLILFGSTPLSVQTPLSRESLEVGPVVLNQARAVGFIMAIICAIGLYLVLTRTNLRQALPSAAHHPIAAAYVGIDVDSAHRLAFGLGVGITAVARGRFPLSQPFHTDTGLA